MRFLLVIALAAMPVFARTRAVKFPNHERILWIGAHPDDESLVAPLLGKKCVEENAACTLLIMSRGENSVCRLPDGCMDRGGLPVLGSIRASEGLAAGAALHAVVIQWKLPDVFNPEVLWPATLVDDIAAVIATLRPDEIFTFDPNHGSSCHQAHRFTAQAVLRAAGKIPVTLLETEIIRSPAVSFAPATTSASTFDARRWWDWFVLDLQTHRSQFTPDEVADIRNLPEEQKRIWLMPAESLVAAQYAFHCE